MSEPRIEIEDLGELSKLPPEDPRRKAFESQPSARARLKAYEDFMAAGGDATTAERAEAEAKLGELIERETGVSPATARRGAAPVKPAGGSWLAWLLGPRMRPVFATAALLVVVALGVTLERGYRAGQEPVYRDGGAPPATGAWDARLAVDPVASGGTRLSWAAAPGADAYTVVFLSADLAEIARVEVVTATALELTPGALPAGLASGTEALWRVIARHGDDEIGSSPTAPVRVP